MRLIDRSTREATSPLDAFLDVCQPDLVNGYSLRKAGFTPSSTDMAAPLLTAQGAEAEAVTLGRLRPAAAGRHRSDRYSKTVL